MKTGEMFVVSGDPVKALNSEGSVGGYLVRFSTEADPDLSGEFFTAKTYFGPRDGDGADLMFHHGQPIKDGLEVLTDHLFKPLKTTKDDIGIFAEAVLDLANEYEKVIHKLAREGKLGWSSGTAKHMIRRDAGGEIKRWPIIEGSLTPTPAEPRNKASAIKSLDDFLSESTIIKARPNTEREFERLLTQEMGFSRSEARVILNKGFKALGDESDEIAQIAQLLRASPLLRA